MPYLFAHFKEKYTPDGEAVYFAISEDGLHWEQTNNGNPILRSSLGDMGCRDIEIIRLHTGGFVILTTDLCIARHSDENHNVNWKYINSHGSKCFCMWKSPDLINFSAQKLISMGREDFGCMWAPEIFFDSENREYLIHWGSTVAEDGFSHMSVYCSVTKDFEQFSPPKLFFSRDNEILDSHITKVGNTYHLFYKNASAPSMNMHAVSESLYGPYRHDEAFEEYMTHQVPRAGSYEAPTVYSLADGRWCLMLDFFGCEKEKMGYVPFVSSKAGDMNFIRSPEEFSFPYGFKHGRVMEITPNEYKKLKEL